MSTQPSELPKMPTLPKIEDWEEPKSVLDGPWKVTLLPDDEVPTIAVPPPDAAPPSRKSLPWRRGDVARLRDDTPEGMMRYIATHTSGWWQEMAERALRDTDKAERMAEEAGWKFGQYWTLEPDVEAREKMQAQEEARRQRDEQESAREQAEKEAFAARQMELLKKAGKAPRCEYLYTDGRACRAPQVRGERWCHGHAKTMSYRPEKLEMLPMEDEQAVTVNLYRVTRSLLSGSISEKVAGLMLWSVAIAAPTAKRAKKTKTHRGGAEARRKRKADLPQMNADGRRSERRSSCRKVQKQRVGDRDIARDRKSKIHPGVTRHKSFRSGVGRGSRRANAANRQDGENTSKQHGPNRHFRDLSTPPRSAGACSESLKMTVIKECGRKGTHASLSKETQKKEIAQSKDRHRMSGHRKNSTRIPPCLRGGELNVRGRQNCVFPPGGIIL